MSRSLPGFAAADNAVQGNNQSFDNESESDSDSESEDNGKFLILFFIILYSNYNY